MAVKEEEALRQPMTRVPPDSMRKITIKDSFGGGRRPSDAEEKEGGAFIGTIKGIASGFRVGENTNPSTGEISKFEMLTGDFFAVPVPGSGRRETASKSLYLPGGFHEDALDVVAPHDPTSGVRKASGNEITFVLEIYCVQSTNASGYAYRIANILNDKKDGNVNTLELIESREREARQQRTKLLVAHEGGKKATA
jgi:hypothetical protein